MVLRVTDDEKFLQIIDCTLNELEQLEYSFTKKVDNWFIIKKKRPNWDGEVKFIDQFQRIPIGLWQEVKDVCKQFHFPLSIEGVDKIINSEHDYEEFNTWAIDYFEKSRKTPRDYQLEACNRVLKYKNCTEEISTSGGKTLIAFLIFKWLLDTKKIKKLLYIVPNINLVTQSEDGFYEYEDECGKRPNWKSDCVFGSSRKKEDNANVVFGTYQSLKKKDVEYFSEFDAVCVDETHHAKSNSIKEILVKCVNAEYKFGLTGTLPKKGSCDSFTIQSYIGPKVYTISSADLINDGNATPVNVIGIELDYLEEEIKKKLFKLRANKNAEDAEIKDGVKLLNLEKSIARNSRKRFNYIVEKIAATTKNSLVLFGDIKNGYGRKIFEWTKENTDKTVYYIDGDTKNDIREYYKEQMEERNDVIIIASVGTFSEGISINNVHNIFIVESYKSDFIVRQILGRGMRLMLGKEKILVIDVSDNYEYGTGYQKKNYLLKHSEERENIYNEKEFPFKRFKVKL